MNEKRVHKRDNKEELDLLKSQVEELDTRLNKLVEIIEILNTCTHIRELAPRFLTEFARNMTAEGGSLYLRDNNKLVLINSLDPEHAASVIEFPLKKGSVFERVFTEKKPVLIRNIKEENDLSQSGWTGYRNQSVIAFPFCDEIGDVIGVLSLHNKTAPPFTMHDHQIGTILSSMICKSIRESHARNELKKSEERFRHMADSSPFPISIIDKDGSYLFLNEKFIELFGYTLSDIPHGRTWFQLAYPDPEYRRKVIQTWKQDLEKCPNGLLRPQEYQVHCKDGSIKEILFRPVTMDDGKQFITYEDRTDQNRVELVRQESESLIRSLLNTSPDISFLIDCRGILLALNETFAQRFKKTVSELIGMNCYDLIPPDLAKSRKTHIDEVINTGKPASFIDRHQERYFENHIHPIKNPYGEVIQISIFAKDITEIKQTEEALRNSEVLYHSLVEHLPQCIFRKDKQGRFTFVNHCFCENLGKSADEIIGKTDFDFFPQELASKYQEDDQRVIESGELFQTVEEHQVNDGDSKYVEVVKTPIKTAAEQIIGIQGIFWDVTEKKRTDEDLKQHLDEIERLNRLFIGRERKLIDLKQRVNELSIKSNLDPPYNLASLEESLQDESQSIAQFRKPDAETLPIHEYTLSDLIEIDSMECLLNSYCESVAIASAIIDLKGNVIIGARWQPICTDFHRINPITCERCIESDTVLAGNVKEGEHFSIYQCRNGLTDAASPIYIAGRHVANVFVGQFLTEPPDYDYFRNQALEYGFDAHQYIKSLEQVPVIDQEKLPSILRFLTTVSELVAQIGLEKIQLKQSESAERNRALELDFLIRELKEQRLAALNLAEEAEEARIKTEQSEKALQESNFLVNTLFDYGNIGLAITSPQKGWIRVNRKLCEMFGYSENEFYQRTWVEMTHPEDLETDVLQFNRLLNDEIDNYEMEKRFYNQDGYIVYTYLTVSCFRNEDRSVRFVIASLLNLTKLKESEEELNKTRGLLEAAIDQSPAGILIADAPDVRIRSVNPAALGIRGESRVPLSDISMELHPQNWQIFHPDGTPCQPEDLPLTRAILYGETTHNAEFIIRRSGSEDRYILATAAPVRNTNGDIVAGVVVFPDITDRKRAEETIEKNEKIYREAIEAAGAVVYYQNYETNQYDFMSPGIEKLLGCTSIEITPDMFYSLERESILTGELAGLSIDEAIQKAREKGMSWKADYRMNKKTGEEIWLSNSAVQVRDEGGETIGSLGILIDITDRKSTENALLQSEERYRLFLANSTEGIWRYEGDQPVSIALPVDEQIEQILQYGYMAECNDALARMYGFDRAEEIIGLSLRDLTSDDPKNLENLRTFIQSGYRLIDSESFAKDREGKIHYFLNSFVGIIEKEYLVRAWGVQRDITERKYAEEEKAKLERQLRQSQKMEAIGQLTGGIAHDFNNLLQVINGYTDMVLSSLPTDEQSHSYLKEVAKAGERAAILVNQLLTFSRRQLMKAEVINLNDIIADFVKMISRVIGEHIRLDYVPGYHLGMCYADRGMMDQVLMNLCVNARDAMPDGGILTIETKNVLIDTEYCEIYPYSIPGQYVLLNVTDTGCGMNEEIRSKIFEPFYTTKEAGHGTGLGLSTVYGIVKQHNGIIQVYSELGSGTTFKIYLPVYEQLATTVGRKVEETSTGGTETILLAEDDEMVRNLAKKFLESAGYKVLPAKDGEEAVRLFYEHSDEIALLIFDVIMPNLGGQDAYERIQKNNQAIKILFASGYSENAIHTNFVIKEGLQIIQKPYNRNQLLSRIREILDKDKKFN